MAKPLIAIIDNLLVNAAGKKIKPVVSVKAKKVVKKQPKGERHKGCFRWR